MFVNSIAKSFKGRFKSSDSSMETFMYVFFLWAKFQKYRLAN